jgi:hypothetical protein
LIQFQPFIQFDGPQGLADRLFQAGEALQALTDLVNFGLVKFKAFEQGSGQVVFPGFGNIFAVGFDDTHALGKEGLAYCLQGLVLCLRTKGRQLNRSPPCRLCQCLNIHPVTPNE